MSLSSRKNIGAFIKSAYAGDRVDVTAAGSGDNTLVNGAAVDLIALGGPLSGVVSFAVKANIANTKTLSLTAAVQTAADKTNGPWTNIATLATTVVANGTGASQTTTYDFDVDFSGAKQYVRVAYTPLCSATGTDTANILPVFTLGGQAEIPV